MDSKNRHIDILIGVINPHEILKDCCKGVTCLDWYKNLVNLRSVDIRMMINAGIYSIRHLYKTDKTQIKLNEDKDVPVGQCVLSECVCNSDSASLFFQNGLNASMAPRISEAFITKQRLLGYSEFCIENLVLCPTLIMLMGHY